MLRKFVFALAISAGAIGISTDAQASVLETSTESQRIDRADLIIRGTVVESWVEHNLRDMVMTHYLVDTTMVLKGDAPDGYVHVAVLGGEMASFRTVVAGAARYNVGEDVLLLLSYKEKFDHYVTMSMAKGKYTIRLDPDSRREVIQRVAVPSNLKYDHRFLPFPSADERVFAEDFEERVLGIVSGRIPVEVPR